MPASGGTALGDKWRLQPSLLCRCRLGCCEARFFCYIQTMQIRDECSQLCIAHKAWVNYDSGLYTSGDFMSRAGIEEHLVVFAMSYSSCQLCGSTGWDTYLTVVYMRRVTGAWFVW